MQEVFLKLQILTFPCKTEVYEVKLPVYMIEWIRKINLILDNMKVSELFSLMWNTLLHFLTKINTLFVLSKDKLGLRM